MAVEVHGSRRCTQNKEERQRYCIQAFILGPLIPVIANIKLGSTCRAASKDLPLHVCQAMSVCFESPIKEREGGYHCIACTTCLALHCALPDTLDMRPTWIGFSIINVYPMTPEHFVEVRKLDASSSGQRAMLRMNVDKASHALDPGILMDFRNPDSADLESVFTELHSQVTTFAVEVNPCILRIAIPRRQTYTRSHAHSVFLNRTRTWVLF